MAQVDWMAHRLEDHHRRVLKDHHWVGVAGGVEALGQDNSREPARRKEGSHVSSLSRLQ